MLLLTNAPWLLYQFPSIAVINPWKNQLRSWLIFPDRCSQSWRKRHQNRQGRQRSRSRKWVDFLEITLRKQKEKKEMGPGPKVWPQWHILPSKASLAKGSRTLLNSFTSGMGIQYSNTCNTVVHFNSTQQQLYVGEYWAFLSWYYRWKFKCIS